VVPQARARELRTPRRCAERSFYEKAGFRAGELRLVVDIDTVEGRLAADS